MARWRAEHPDFHRAYRARERDRFAGYKSKRRALQVGNGGSHTPQEWQDKKALFAFCCAYCGEAKKLERDHKIPLTRGGSDDITNIVPCCRACNQRKHQRTAMEFLAV